MFDFTVLLHVSATSCSHLHGATMCNDVEIYRMIVLGTHEESLNIVFCTTLNPEENPAFRGVWMQHFKLLLFFLYNNTNNNNML